MILIYFFGERTKPYMKTIDHAVLIEILKLNLNTAAYKNNIDVNERNTPEEKN